MKKGERRKDELIKIAYKKFLKNGYEQTSVDEIIEEAQIAKGTFYYHFPSKEATLAAVIDMMIDDEVYRAKEIIAGSLPVSEKLAAVIYSFRPSRDEQSIANAVNAKDNIILHEKLNKRLIAEAVPLLSEIVKEGIRQGVFECEQVEERVKMIFILSFRMFDDGDYTQNDVTAFIDMAEKTIGAKPGTMDFISELLPKGEK